MRRIIFVAALLLWPVISIKSRGDNGLVFSFAENAQSNKLNLYVDITTYGARAVTTVPSTTATCSSGSATVSLTSAGGFQNGDGIRLEGCGATNSMLAPSVPIVTPKIASGPIGTGETVNSPTGSTTYKYQCVAADKQGAYTAASPVGSTTTALARLGDSGAVSVSSISRSGNVVTVITSSATNIITGAAVWIQGVNDGSFNGAFRIASAPSRKQFTYVSGVTTANGGSTSSTGGTVDYYLANEIACPAISGSAWKYFIYLNGTLIGQTKPLENIYDDWGAILRGTSSFPAYIPTSAPVSPGDDALVTTIMSGAGSTTLALANSATNAASGTRAVFDDSPAILAAVAAAGGAPVVVPNVSSGSFVVNPFTSLGGATILENGPLTLNETVQGGSGITWKDTLAGTSRNAPSFALTNTAKITIGPAYPGVYLASANAPTLEGLYFSSGSDQALDVLVDGGGGSFGGTLNRLTFTTGNALNSEDYLGIGFENRGQFGIKLENTTLAPSMANNGPTGLWAPEVYSRGAVTCCGTGSQFTMKTTSTTAKGFLFEATWANSTASFFIDWFYSQGPRSPMISLSEGVGVNVGGQLYVKDSTVDTSCSPSFTNFAPGIVPTLIVENFGPTGCGGMNVTGNPIPIFATANVSLGGINSGVTWPPFFSDDSMAITGTGSFTFDFTSPPPAPTLALAPGGSLSVGTHTFAVQFIDINGNVSAMGPASKINVTAGNQTVHISLPSFPQGVALWFPIIDGSNSSPPPHDMNQCTSIVPTATWNANNDGFLCNNGHANKPSSAAGPTSISRKGVNAATFNIINNGFTATPEFQGGGLTANRTFIVPDGAGAIVLTASLTTTAAASDNVTIQGVTSSSHCWPAATNAAAAANILTVYISRVSANQVTIMHKATSGMTFTIACTPN